MKYGKEPQNRIKLMTHILTEFSLELMATAIEQNHEDQLVNLGRSLDAKRHETSELKWFVSRIPSPIFNVVARTRLSPESADKKVKELVKIAKTNKVPLGWWVFPSSTPGDLGERLLSHGFSYKGHGHCGALDLTQINLHQEMPEGMTIDPVVDEASLKLFLQPFTQAHNIPERTALTLYRSFARMGLGPDRPYRHYVVRMDGTPAASHSMLLSAGVAGGYNAVVLPEYRKRGIAKAMSLYLSREAYVMGYRFRVGIASDMMWPISKRIGYIRYFKANYYEWDGRKKGNDENKMGKITRLVKKMGRMVSSV